MAWSREVRVTDGKDGTRVVKLFEKRTNQAGREYWNTRLTLSIPEALELTNKIVDAVEVDQARAAWPKEFGSDA